MSFNTYKNFGTAKTPQSQPIPGSDQVQNNAGGFTWAIDDWKRLDRFLILGSDGGTYYVNQQELTKRNADAVIRCVKEDGKRVVDRIVEVSQEGLAPSNEPALFALAIAISMGDVETRQKAADNLYKVARIGTHLFHFAQYAQQFRGWGPLLKKSVASWYNGKPVDSLVYQLIKYQQRDGWSHRDLLRLSHPEPVNGLRSTIYKWVTSGESPDFEPSGSGEDAKQIYAFEQAKKATTAKEIVNLISEYRLPREAIPTQFLNDNDVWEALLEQMPIFAMIRNLSKMTSIGLIEPMSQATTTVVNRLADQELLMRARVHPLSVLLALKTYQAGHGARGHLSWNPVSQVVDALDGAFYLAFKAVEPTNKRTLLALDVSGSMQSGNVAGAIGVTPRIAAAAMALVTAKVEPSHAFVIFSSEGTNFYGTGNQKYRRTNPDYMDGVSEFDISPRERLDDVVRRTSGLPFGGTDCALPMIYAEKRGWEIDTFVIYTDNETWAGSIHPSQALEGYRRKTGIPARLVVVGMTSTGFSIADPNDPGSMDVVGFNSSAPKVIADFSAGRF
jgi:60 kDa SS-A/Ro ribonucleoprotein